MKEENVEMVSIPLSEYNELRYNTAVLYALERGGVDNWEGYDYSLENMEYEEYSHR